VRPAVVWGRGVCPGLYGCSGLISCGVVSVLHRGNERFPDGVGLVVWCSGERPVMVLRWMGSDALCALFVRRAECVACASSCSRGSR